MENDRFNYLLVVVGIIVGLGLSQLLTGVVELIRGRERVRFYWLPFVWMGLLMLQQLQYYWILYDSRALGENFARYLAALLYPTCMYVASGLLVPRLPEQGVLDLRAHYYDMRRWFFAVCMAGMVVLLFEDSLVRGAPWPDAHYWVQPVRLAQCGGLVLVFLLWLFIVEAIHVVLSLVALLTLVLFVLIETLHWSPF